MNFNPKSKSKSPSEPQPANHSNTTHPTTTNNDHQRPYHPTTSDPYQYRNNNSTQNQTNNHPTTSTCPSLPPLPYLSSTSTNTGQTPYPGLDSLLLEIQETMKQTNSSRTPSPHHHPSSVPFPIPQTNSTHPPPVPPKVPHGFSRKISMPSLSSSSLSHDRSHRTQPNPPPVPRLPDSYSSYLDSEPVMPLNHHQNPHHIPPSVGSSSRIRADSVLDHTRRRPSQPSNSLLNFVRRPLPNPHYHQNPTTPTSSSYFHLSPDRTGSQHSSSNQTAGSSMNVAMPYTSPASIPSVTLTGTIRPLPHLPNSSSSPTTSSTTDPPSPIPSSTHSTRRYHTQSQPKPVSNHNTSVSYTHVLHDYDSPLGAHSIPTRISTRPINFNSSEPTLPPMIDTPHHSVDAFNHLPDDRPPGSLPNPIDPADRAMFLDGTHLLGRSKTFSNRDPDPRGDDLNSSLQIYTTRPSTDITRPELDTRFTHAPSSFIKQDLGSSHKPSSQMVIGPGFNIALITHIGKFLKDNVPRGTKIKGSIEYPSAFTGREVVSTITHCLNRINPSTKSTTQATLNRKLALTLSRRLLQVDLFHEVNNLNHEIILNDNIDEVYMFDDDLSSNNKLTQCVLTNLTGCYSFSCRVGSKVGGCYSYDCPRRTNRDSVLGRTTSLVANTLISDTPASTTVVQQTPQQDWASVVPKELIATLDSKEIARQSIIYEVISGEQEYVQDLDDFEKLFINPIKSLNPPIIPLPKLNNFVTKVISNVLEVRNHNRILLQNLLIRQKEQHPIVKGIGDLILNSALEWGDDYIRYTNDHVFGEVEVNDEKRVNTSLADLLNQIPKQSPRRADFKHYYLRASVRLQRYILLLESLLKKTPEGHEDRSNIEAAIDVIKRQCKDANLSVELQQAKLNLVKLNNEIVGKPDTPDLQLLSPNRQLFHSGKLVRKPEGGTGLTDWAELNVWLFDHYLIMTKCKRVDENTVRYPIWRQPIMLELLRVSGFNEPPERRSRGLRTITGTLGSGTLERGNSDPYSTSSSTGVLQANGHHLTGPSTSSSNNQTGGDELRFPFTIHVIGRQSYTITLYVDSDRIRQTWRSKLEEAVGMRLQILDTFKVFDLHPMTDQTFGAGGSVSLVNGGGGQLSNGSGSGMVGGVGGGGSVGMSNGGGGSGGEMASNIHGPPTCSVPFRSADGKQLIAIGCHDGLWIGLRNDPSSVRQVIHIRSITQCAVLQEFGFLLVLAEKILLAYPLESLVPSKSIFENSNNVGGGGKKGGGGSAIASRLSGNKDVLFFRCGKVGPRTLVIYVKKGGVNQTVFKALEPVKNHDKLKTTTSRGFLGIGGQKSESFRGYKEFFVPSESYAIQYLRSTLAIHCARGFEIMNLDTLKTASIPDFHQIRQNDQRIMALQRRCDVSRPLGMFRLGENEFLLCYDEFAFFADKHGDPLSDRYDSIMEWDGKPSSVAYSAPYIIGFSSNLVEIWNTHSSKRVQVILGQGMSCTYDGGSLGDDGTLYVTGSSGSGSTDEGERRVHLVVKDPDSFYRVFELVPLGI